MFRIKSIIMASKDKMPTTVILLFFSWLIASIGAGAALYMIIINFNKISSWISGLLILSGSLLLAAVIRMLGNLGQMFFDLTLQLQNQEKRVLAKSELSNQTLIQELRVSFQSQTADLRGGIEDVIRHSKEISGHLSQLMASLDQLNRHSDNINQNTSQLMASLDQLNYYADNINQNTSQLMASLDQLNRHSSEIKSLSEQSSSDSKDINQSINQIKDFFEKIERHLDLKK